VTRIFAGCLGLALVACGTNRPEIPPELLENPATSVGCSTPNYPAPPYGEDPSDTAGDLCFQGFRTPLSVPHDQASLGPVSFGNFYDPLGEKYEILLVNTAAIWCAVCKTEHRSLPDHYTELAPHGLAILSALFQDASRQPATVADLKTWVETFEPPFPMVLDSDYQLGTYAAADTAPLNLVIDARTMKIMQRFTGDQSQDLWSLIEGELARREASE